MIETPRLTLVPATLPLARAEIADRPEFARLLRADVPENWPPDSTADALPTILGWMEAAPDRAGWFGWFALAGAAAGGPPVLVGGGGFHGPPESGTAQMGYSVLPQFEGMGYATEMVGGLVRWAFAEGAARLAAETEWANPASVRVLEKNGFRLVGPAGDAGGGRFELRAGG